GLRAWSGAENERRPLRPADGLRGPSAADGGPGPLPDPVGPAPPVPPLPSCSPTVMFTCETVPLNVATSDAPASGCCADVNESFAEARLVWAAAIWADDGPAASSCESFGCARTTGDSAEVSRACGCGEPRVPRPRPGRAGS